jgi:uncharacterized protein (UPF0335 family)
MRPKACAGQPFRRALAVLLARSGGGRYCRRRIDTELAGNRENMADTGGIAGERLRSFIERIERLEEEKAALASDIREVFSEAKSAGFDTKIMRQVLRLRKLDSAERQEQEALLDLYKQAIGLAG